MAKKPTAPKKGRKTTASARKRPPRRPTAAADSVSLSVTDGAMKDVIRSAFLRRDR